MARETKANLGNRARGYGSDKSCLIVNLRERGLGATILGVLPQSRPFVLISNQHMSIQMVAPRPTDLRPQDEKFKDIARKLECDEDEEAFKARLRQIAKAPKPPAKPE